MSHNVWDVVGRLGIEPLVDLIVDPAALVKGKPDPEIFLAAAEQTGVPVGYVEQLYTFGDRGRHTRADSRERPPRRAQCRSLQTTLTTFFCSSGPCRAALPHLPNGPSWASVRAMMASRCGCTQ